MHTLAAICGFLDIQFKDQEPEGGEHPETPTAVNENAAKVKAMLDQAAKNRQRGGIHANKLPESSSE